MYTFTYSCLIIIFIISHQCKSSIFFDEYKTTQTGPKQSWNETTLDKLKKDLFMNYDKYARPDEHFNTTDLRFGLAILHVQVDELKSTLTLHTWIRLVWNDRKLNWNETEYGGISVARIADHELWHPDLYLFNSAYGGEPVTKFGTHNVLIYPNGEVLWVPSTKLTVLCDFNLRHWPFDTQHCHIVIGSWTHNGNELKLTFYNNKAYADMSDLLLDTANLWIVTNTTAAIITKTHNCCAEPYYEVRFNLTLVRQYMPYRAVIITPAVVLAALILMQFWLPPRCNERLLLNCLIAVVILMFLLYFTNHIAVTGSNTPLIVIFYSASLFMVCLAMLANILMFSISRIAQAQLFPRIITQYLQGNFGKFLLLDCYFEEECISTEGKKFKSGRNEEFNSFERGYMSTSSPWKYNKQNMMLAVVVDRIFFVVYSCVYLLLGFIYLL